MKIHGTMVRIGGGPDKQGHVFSDSEWVEVSDHFIGDSLVKPTFENGVENIILGTKITKVVKHPDRIDVEVDIDTNICPAYIFATVHILYFAMAGKILKMSRTIPEIRVLGHFDAIDDDGIETIERCRVTQLALTPNGVDPAYVVKLGPLPQD